MGAHFYYYMIIITLSSVKVQGFLCFVIRVTGIWIQQIYQISI